MHTIVLQSHRRPLPHAWLADCLASVRAWAGARGYDYRFIGDELFDGMDTALLDKVGRQKVIATDLARLNWMRRLLDEGYQRVVWCDADLLVFEPAGFELIDDNCAVGREVWIQRDERGRLKAYRKVHNAFLMFGRDSAVLDFYRETAERLLQRNRGGMPAQFIGPKLLTALHNVAQFSVQEDAAMFSPLVVEDLLRGGGKASELMLKKSKDKPRAANLCCSSVAQEALDDRQMTEAVRLLLNDGFSATSAAMRSA